MDRFGFNGKMNLDKINEYFSKKNMYKFGFESPKMRYLVSSFLNKFDMARIEYGLVRLFLCLWRVKTIWKTHNLFLFRRFYFVFLFCF